jgi:hypothetical protein
VPVSASVLALFALALLAARGCRSGERASALEMRVLRIESLLGLDDAGTPPLAVPIASASADDRAAPCALAKVAGYQAWQEALVRAKSNATGPEAACAGIWNERRKQACFYAAMSGVRATQAARDAVVIGGATARDAIRAVKDDPKNDALPRARAASQAVFAACDEDAGP